MKRLHEKASITVFFIAAACTILLDFIMMMTEHARIFGLRQHLVCATDSAMDSLFSMYDRELLNEFDLMLLNEKFTVLFIADIFCAIVSCIKYRTRFSV